jgi:hypothetical protein
MHRAAAARAGAVSWLDDDLDPPQVIRQRAAGPPLFGAHPPQRQIGLLLFGLTCGNRVLEILQRQIELVGIELFRALAELHTLELADQMAQPIVLAGELIALIEQPLFLGTLGVALGPRRQDHGAQRSGGVGMGVGRRHEPIIPYRQRPPLLNHRVSQTDAGGRAIRGACTRRQSNPSNNAANCAPDNRITLSLIAGHLNRAPSSRFQISTRPVPS